MKTLLKMKIDRMAHAGGCAGLEGVDVVSPCDYGKKPLAWMSFWNFWIEAKAHGVEEFDFCSDVVDECYQF